MEAGGENKLVQTNFVLTNLSLVLVERTQFDCGIFANSSYATNFKFVSVKNSGKNDSKYDIVSFVCVTKHASKQTMFLVLSVNGNNLHL